MNPHSPLRARASFLLQDISLENRSLSIIYNTFPIVQYPTGVGRTDRPE